MDKQKEGSSPMDKLTQGYEKFIKGKEVKPITKKEFEGQIKKAVKPSKVRGSK